MAYCPITVNDTLSGWTIPDLPDDCSGALSVYCSPSANAPMPSSTVFPSTCSPAYWEAALSSTAASNTATTTGYGAPGPTQTGEPSNCDAWYVVQPNDSCDGVVSKYGNFTLSQFYRYVGALSPFFFPQPY